MLKFLSLTLTIPVIAAIICFGDIAGAQDVSLRAVKTFAEYLAEEKGRMHSWYGAGDTQAAEPIVDPSQMTRSEYMQYRARSNQDSGIKRQISRIASGETTFIQVERAGAAPSGRR